MVLVMHSPKSDFGNSFPKAQQEALFWGECLVVKYYGVI